MKTINFTFIPGVGYSGNYTSVAYGTVNPSIPLKEVVSTGPFGSSVAVSITGLPDDTAYQVKIFTDLCTDPVGTHNFVV